MKSILPITLGLAVSAASALAQYSPATADGSRRLKDFETMRASSSDPNWENGNRDSRPIVPGDTLTLQSWLPGLLRTSGLPSCIRIRSTRACLPCESIGMVKRIRVSSVPSAISSPSATAWNNRLPRCPFASPPSRARNATGRCLPQIRPHHSDQREDQRCVCFYFYVDWQKQSLAGGRYRILSRHVPPGVPCVMARTL